MSRPRIVRRQCNLLFCVGLFVVAVSTSTADGSTGACCSTDDDGCVIGTLEDCLAQGGFWGGEGSTCVVCQPPLCGNHRIDPREECDGGLGCTSCTCDVDWEPADPPSFGCRPFGYGQGRAFLVLGQPSVVGWSWCIDGPPGVSVCDLNVQGIPGGATSAEFVNEFVASINTAGAAINANAVASENVFTVRIPEDQEFSFCVGSFGQQPTCCVAPLSPCLIDPAIREIVLVGLDSDGNGIDDAIDIANRTSGVVPTVSNWGLIIMALLGLAMGTILYGRRRLVKS